MKVLKVLGGIVGVILLLFLVPPLFMSNDYRVERSIDIAKSPQEVYAVVSDYGQRTTWDPWAEKEPDVINVTVTGKPGEVGASYSWVGNETGEGSMTVKETVPGESIHSTLVFKAPMEASCDVYWTFEPSDAGATVKWAFEGNTPYPWNWFNMQMDSNIGPDFEKGLQNLKKTLEG